MSSPGWIRAKSELNHRVLQNQFILAVRAAERDLASGRLTGGLESELRVQVLPRWPELRGRIDQIAAQCEEAISPSALFERPPFNGLLPSEWQWLREVTVGLWKSRYRVTAILSELSAALARVDGAQGALAGAWEDMQDRDRIAGLRELADACLEVSRLLSSLPSRTRGV